MEDLNKYKKIKIILLILIIIAFIFFIISVIKIHRKKEFLVETTYSEITDIAQETPKEIEIPLDEGDILDEEIINEEDTSWDEQAEDTKVDLTEEEKDKETIEIPYYIKINYTANCVTIYKKDKSGKYTIPIKAMVCSTGTSTPTSGVYKMSQKYRWHQLNGGVYGQYCSRITGHILFHSVPYATNSPNSLKYTAYDKLGTKASAGCIRLTVEDAMWIYNNCPSGTYVEFYSSSNSGPLGKPSAQKISSNVECRNWDPTDPTKGNPWHTYTPKVEENKVQEEKNPEVVEENKPTENIPNNNESNDNNNGNDNSNNNSQENNVNNENNNDVKEHEKDDNTTNKTVNETIDQSSEVSENNVTQENTMMSD